MTIAELDAYVEPQGWTKVYTGRSLRIDLTPERVRRRYNSQSLARKVTELQANRLRRIVVTDDTVWRVSASRAPPC
jgi:hypothetical protein